MEDSANLDKNFCRCGCGIEIEILNARKQLKKYAKGHNPPTNGFTKGHPYGKRFKKGHIPANYKGGRITDKDGYICIWNKKEYVPEHRLVWEREYDAIILPWAVVHHKDEKRDNNVWYNLQAMTRAQHIEIHREIIEMYRWNDMESH